MPTISVRSRASRASRAKLPILMVCAAAAAVTSAARLDAQPARKGYQILRAFQERFTLEYPAKDWEPAIAGGTSSLLALTQKKREAAVVVEYQPLRLELAPSEIDEHFAKLEAEPVTTRQPGAGDVGVRLIDVGAARVVVVDYTRKGVAGAERVRQYSFPIGKQLFRLVCSAPAAGFAKYEPVFTAMVESFRVTGAAAPAETAAASVR